MPRFTAGWNMPGYLPESEPTVHDSFADARQHLVTEVERFWDEDTDAPDLDQDERWLAVHTALHVATDTDTVFSASCGDGHLHFWIQPYTGPDCDEFIENGSCIHSSHMTQAGM